MAKTWTYTAQLTVAYAEYVEITITQTPDVANNRSTISWHIDFYITGSGNYYQYNNGNSLNVVLNGVTYVDTGNICSIQLSGSGARKTIASGSFAYNHNADGTGSFPVYVRFDQTQKDGYTATVNETFVCETIPRATTPTLSGDAYPLENALTISLPRASGAFTHALTYLFGSASGTIATGAETSAAWTPPASLASQIPSAGAGVGTITCTTYANGAVIGSRSIPITLTVPDTATFLPTISDVALSEAGDVPADWGLFVQSKSRLQMAITASGKYGASIKSNTVTLLDTTYSGNPITSGYLTKSGAVAVRVKVVDSRNKTAEYTTEIHVEAYQPPGIAVFTAERCTASGVVDGESEHVLLDMEFTAAKLGGRNEAAYEVAYKLASSEHWTALLDGSSCAYEGLVVTEPLFDATKIYQVRLAVQDSFGSAESVQTISTAVIVMHLRGDGKGVSFGEYSQGPGFFVNMDAFFKKSVSALKTAVHEELSVSAVGENAAWTTLTIPEMAGAKQVIIPFYGFRLGQVTIHRTNEWECNAAVTTYRAGEYVVTVVARVDFSTGTIYVVCTHNTWGLAALPVRIPANMVMYVCGEENQESIVLCDKNGNTLVTADGMTLTVAG